MSVEKCEIPKIALVGNPNSGKSTVFNQITGLRQKTGNFPGITVDVKEGKINFPSGKEALLIDLPGAYSFYPTSSDERIVSAVLANSKDPFFPQAIVYVASILHLEKHLLLLTQIMDMGLPVILALNMSDVAQKEGIKVNTAKISATLGIPVVFLSGRTGENIQKLLGEIEKTLKTEHLIPKTPFYPLSDIEKQVAEAVRLNLGIENTSQALLVAHHHQWLPHLTVTERQTVAAILENKGFNSLRMQVEETLDRYDKFTPLVRDSVITPVKHSGEPTDKIDNIVTHRIFGPILFFVIMLMVFQAIYDWSAVPMDWIESGFNAANNYLKSHLPINWFSDLLTDGILAGLSGILVFVPQIALLFFLITILEEVGYMSRVVFMFDRTMQRFGMNGRSVIALISGGACAVPAIMSSRTIGNWHERLITIMVTPFISCSARIPVYAVLIGLAVPPHRIFGFLNLQTLVFASMYLLGTLAALGSGYLMKKFLHTRELAYLAIELPEYRQPHWKNVWLTVWEKVSAFIIGAGKIILMISIVLWALARFGPGDSMEQAKQMAIVSAEKMQMDTAQTADHIASCQLEASWAGQMGKALEPVIRPLGYDWKIGVALIASFAAREVFVGTMSTIYSIGSSGEDDTLLREKMKSAVYVDTGKPVYTLATALSLLVFYALAMQCMSTIATVKRETNSWRWALLQFVFMSLLAYVSAWAVFSVAS